MFGTIVDIFIPKKSGVARSLAFIRFKHEMEVVHLINLNPELFIGSRKVSLAWGRKLSQPESSSVKVFGDQDGPAYLDPRGKLKVPLSEQVSSQMLRQSLGFYKDVLLRLNSSNEAGKKLFGEFRELVGKQTIQFSYVQRETQQWMNRSVVGLRKVGSDVGVMQCQIMDVGGGYSCPSDRRIVLLRFFS